MVMCRMALLLMPEVYHYREEDIFITTDEYDEYVDLDNARWLT
jgi:hypothetical protein